MTREGWLVDLTAGPRCGIMEVGEGGQPHRKPEPEPEARDQDHNKPGGPLPWANSPTRPEVPARTGQHRRQHNMTATQKATQPRLCACGCGIEITSRSKKVEFCPGHDAKLKSMLVQRALKGDTEALDELVRRDWDHFLTKAKPKHSGPCLCGCGQDTKPESRFRPGHDATLKSRLIDEALLGELYAEARLLELGWSSHLEAKRLKLQEKQAQKAKAKAKREADQLAKAQAKQAKPQAQPQVQPMTKEQFKAQALKDNRDKAQAQA